MRILRRLRPARRRGWIWLLLTAGTVLNGLRLRDRLSRIDVLDQPADGSGLLGGPEQPPPDESSWGVFVTAAGVSLDRRTRLAAVSHARRHGVQVLDLVPGDLPTEQVLDLTRQVDTTNYRDSPLAIGRCALHALLLAPGVAEKLDLTHTDGLDVVEMARVATAAKQVAPRTTDLAIAPGLEAVAMTTEQRLPYLRAIAGTFANSVASMPIAQYGLVAAGLLASPGWGVAALVASSAQPWLVTAGTAINPRDLGLRSSATRWLRLPLEASRSLRSKWEPAVEVAGDPRVFARLVPEYQALTADGTAKFFESPRTTCPLCGGGGLQRSVEVRDLIQHKPGRFNIDLCNGCGHLFQNPRLSLDGLDFYYRDFYDGLAADDTEMVFAATDASYRGRVEMVAKFVEEPERWLDVGAGHGHFCLVAAEHLPGTRFDGLDMSDSVTEAARRGWVTEGYQGQLPEMVDGLSGTFDVVSMNHYLEHTREPLTELDAAATVLKRGGHLFIELPNPECAFRPLLGRFWGPLFQPQHQHFVSLANLRDALVDRGFTVVHEEVGEALQPADFMTFVALVAQSVAPLPAKPWLPEPSAAQRLGRAATFAAFAPVLVLAAAADHLLAPIFRRMPATSNAYRVLARYDREEHECAD